MATKQIKIQQYNNNLIDTNLNQFAIKQIQVV